METEYKIRTRVASHAAYEGTIRRVERLVEDFIEDYGDTFRLVNITTSTTSDKTGATSGWIATAVFDNEPELDRERRRKYREADMRGLFARAARPAPSSHEFAGWTPPRPQPHVGPHPVSELSPRAEALDDPLLPGDKNPEVIFSPPMCCCRPMVRPYGVGNNVYKCEVCKRVRAFGIGDVPATDTPFTSGRTTTEEEEHEAKRAKKSLRSWINSIAYWGGGGFRGK